MHRFLVLIILALPMAAVAEHSFPERLAGAERGIVADMRETGRAYYLGDAVERDCYEARRWLKRAAEAGDAGALYSLGTIDDEGSCGIAQAESAVDYYRRAAEKGHAGALYRLGELYRQGRGVDPDPSESVRLLTRAAGQGEPLAYCSLARLYAKGSGVAASRQKAQSWLRKGLGSRSDEAVALCREVQAEAGL